jgi:mRNA interferase MazF
MKRGDVVLVAVPGDFGKPRPAVIVQTDYLNESHSSVIVCILTSHLVDAPLFRLTIEPNDEAGLQSRSQLMIDRVFTLRREKIGKKIGVLDESVLLQIDRMLAVVLGLAGK